MLTEFQKEKLTHYFKLLDYDHNGVIEKADFTAIAENLCILWGFKEGTEQFNKYTHLFGQCWTDFKNLIQHSNPHSATMEEWFTFADIYLVNGEEDFFNRYILKVLSELFDCFDANGDGFISLEEYIDLFMAYHIEVRYSAKSFIRLDLNNDDLLSKVELLTAVEQFFKSDDQESPGNWLFGFWGDRETI